MSSVVIRNFMNPMTFSDFLNRFDLDEEGRALLMTQFMQFSVQLAAFIELSFFLTTQEMERGRLSKLVDEVANHQVTMGNQIKQVSEKQNHLLDQAFVLRLLPPR